MSNTVTRYNKSVEASTKHLAEVRDFVAEHAVEFGFRKQDVADIRLAVDEAYTNIIKHAYEDNPGQLVDITLGYNRSEFWISLRDTGRTFDPASYSKPDLRKKMREKKRGGVGVYLIRRLMDDVQYRQVDGENEIRMIKKR